MNLIFNFISNYTYFCNKEYSFIVELSQWTTVRKENLRSIRTRQPSKFSLILRPLSNRRKSHWPCCAKDALSSFNGNFNIINTKRYQNQENATIVILKLWSGVIWKHVIRVRKQRESVRNVSRPKNKCQKCLPKKYRSNKKWKKKQWMTTLTH